MLLTDPILQELSGLKVAESRVLPSPVIEDLNVLKTGRSHVGMEGHRAYLALAGS